MTNHKKAKTDFFGLYYANYAFIPLLAFSTFFDMSFWMV